MSSSDSEESLDAAIPPLQLIRTRRLSSIKSDLIKFEVECLKFVLRETCDKLSIIIIIYYILL